MKTVIVTEFESPGANKTYLAGLAGNSKVVTMGNDTIIDGFIVKEGVIGIYGINDDFAVANCVIAHNTEQGIYSESGDVAVKWCVLKENDYEGIYHSGNGKTLTVENCMVYENKQHGIYSRYSVGTILNSLIYENGSGSDVDNTYYGINMYRPSDNPEIRNNTIVHNANEGINFEDTDGDYPDIYN